MPEIVRLWDTSDHGGTVITAATRVYCRGLLVARRGDLHTDPNHGTRRIAEGSPKVYVERAPVARTGDAVECGALLIALQQSVFAG